MSLEEKVKGAIKGAFEELFDYKLEEHQLTLLPTRKEFDGNYTFVTFPVARFSKKNPEETAKLLGEAIKKSSDITEDFNVVKGFLNIEIII